MANTGNAWNKRITTEDEKFIIDEYKAGKSSGEILKSFNGKFKTGKTILDVLRKYDVKRRDGVTDYVKINHFYFSNIDKKEKAYLLGFIIADGWVHSKRNQVGISCQDRHVIELAKKEWETPNKIIEVIKKTPITTDDGKEYFSKKPMHQLIVHSKKMIDDLAILGIVDRKSLITTLPLLDKDMQAHMMRGIIDGDGTVYVHSNGKDPCIRFLGSHYLMAQIALFLHLELGLAYKIPMIKGNISAVEWTIRDEVLVLARYLYKDSTESTRLRRKHEKIKSLIC